MLRLLVQSGVGRAAQLVPGAAGPALQRLVGVVGSGGGASDTLPSRSLAGSARLDQQPMPAAADSVAKEEPRASYLL